MITAFRLYLSAHTPHSGTSGSPTTKTSELNSPMNASRSVCATPICPRYDGSRAKIWLTPIASTMEVTQKTATGTRQSWAARFEAGRPPGASASGGSATFRHGGHPRKPTRQADVADQVAQRGKRRRSGAGPASVPAGAAAL